MTIEIGLTDEYCNTNYAPLAAIWVHYQRNRTLAPLAGMEVKMKTRDLSAQDKIQQVLLSILSGCATVSEINTTLKHERALAQGCGWDRIADQSNLSRSLDGLSLMNIRQLRQAVAEIWVPTSQLRQHDWRGFLWFDFDLSGLTCGKLAEKSQKGYFSAKKTPQVVN